MQPQSNDGEVLLKVEKLSKKFCKDLKTSLWYGVQDLLSNIRGNKNERQLRDKEFWAVKDISFELRRGECLGLIGHNGAGKSTLLKILNGLINPDAGKVTIKGRVGALIELGAGFNPILTGRENIFNNGAILGFTRKEIEKKLEEIIEFAEIREFIDMPVQHYSSGMKVRLGFAVAAQMQPDVLLIDEVLAVGDVGFRVKCMNRISELMKNTAILFVSHSMPQIAKLSSRVLLLENGKILENTRNVSSVITRFLSYFEMEKSIKLEKENTKVFIADIIEKDFDKNLNAYSYNRNEKIKFKFDIEVDKKVKEYFITLLFLDVELKPIAAITSLSDGPAFKNKGRTIHTIEIENYFAPGRYSINCNAVELNNQKQWGRFLFQYQNRFVIQVINENSFTHVPIQLKADWN